MGKGEGGEVKGKRRGEERGGRKREGGGEGKEGRGSEGSGGEEKGGKGREEKGRGKLQHTSTWFFPLQALGKLMVCLSACAN
jgi:hypothetical protein